MEFVDDDYDYGGHVVSPLERAAVLSPVSPVTHAALLVGARDDHRIGMETKTPMLDTLIYCAVRGWGVHIMPETPSAFYFSNFELYHHCAALISRKHAPPPRTLTNRAKALKVWFMGVPTSNDEMARDFWVYPKDMKRAETLLRKVKEMRDNH